MMQSSLQFVIGSLVLLLILAVHVQQVESFSNPPALLSTTSATTTAPRLQFTSLRNAMYDDDDEDFDDDDEDDEFIDTDSLGDWRAFRRNLAFDEQDGEETEENEPSSSLKTKPIKSVSKANEEILISQNEKLAAEYLTGVWAHPVATPEVGGLVARMPLERELFENYKHSILGKRLFQLLDGETELQTWYHRAKKLVEDEMKKIAGKADDQGQIDATTLDEVSSEMLTLFLDNQDNWQEVCLVVEHANSVAKTVVLNRPMGFKLTDNIARLVLNGAFSTRSNKSPNDDDYDDDDDDDDQNTNGDRLMSGDSRKEGFMDRKALVRFMTAFASECAVYVGGPDDQNMPALMIHGIPDLPGAREISPGSNIYQGGIDAAVKGVLEGEYSPLEFRFFVGCHKYKESALDVAVHLGKYQPIACARSLALKQCISLPKPLWHEVMELCGGELGDLSALELSSADDMQFQVVDETEYDGPEGGLENMEDEDDDFYL
mmetsp:Transcript_15035/g.36735  ORF Transcript_15035/g.36735 Transcript_15035/m.36735 type:complete len:490 (+) Transcript_15035:270-1739(+)